MDIEDVKIGDRLEMFRIANYNYPRGKLGSFNTSIVEKIEIDPNNSRKLKIWTTNSIYLVEYKEFVKENYNNDKIYDSKY